jgi:hypothetical protein
MVNGITIDELAARFPRLYHMAAEGSWPGIERHGLRSTSALLDLFEITGEQRRRLESQHRPECVTIEHPDYGIAVIRDQKPMDDLGLTRALRDNLRPGDWYRILNNKVFFWLTRERLKTLLTAKAYRNKRHTVLVLDTRRLLERGALEVLLSPMNSGCTKPFPHPRGPTTFLPLSEYPFHSRAQRGLEPVVELAVDYLVGDVPSLLLAVVDMGGGSTPSAIIGSLSDVE